MRIYTGNLSSKTTEDSLKAAFSAHGTVETCMIPKDKNTGTAKSFGFIEMNDEAEAKAAISALDGTEFEGNTIKVNESKPKTHSNQGMQKGN